MNPKTREREWVKRGYGFEGVGWRVWDRRCGIECEGVFKVMVGRKRHVCSKGDNSIKKAFNASLTSLSQWRIGTRHGKFSHLKIESYHLAHRSVRCIDLDYNIRALNLLCLP